MSLLICVLAVASAVQRHDLGPALASTTLLAAELDDSDGSVQGYSTRDEGQWGSDNWKRFLVNATSHVELSYWHDIPLYTPMINVVHAFIEIPRNTQPKFECTKDVSYNPIMQDRKTTEHGETKLRNYTVAIRWNYGAFPQTWEQPSHVWLGLEDKDGNIRGDNDPVDLVDLSTIPVETGTVIRAKPIGALAMLDTGEVDWKVIVINMADPNAAKVCVRWLACLHSPPPQPLRWLDTPNRPLAHLTHNHSHSQINSLADAEKIFPGEVDRIREWFQDYKAIQLNTTTPTSMYLEPTKVNKFGYDNKALDSSQAMAVIAQGHEAWTELVTRKTPPAERNNLKLS